MAATAGRRQIPRTRLRTRARRPPACVATPFSRMYEAVAEAAMVFITAMPSDPPICWVVFSRPDATPASWGETPNKRGGRQRDEDEPEPHAHQDFSREDKGGELCARAELGEPQHAERGRDQTTKGERAGTEPGKHLAG